MCRQRPACSELPADPAEWSRTCPLPRPGWFDAQLEVFEQALSALAMDDRARGLARLAEIPSAEMQTWYIEHGQMAGMHRVNRLGTPNPISVPDHQLDMRRSPRRHEREVYTRDGFRCRYCGSRLIEPMVLAAFAARVGGPEFEKGSTNLTTHGMILAFHPVVDHVIPWRVGGRTAPGNLVSACWPCNYGKSGYTIEQLGIENPFARPPVVDAWDGFASYLEALR